WPPRARCATGAGRSGTATSRTRAPGRSCDWSRAWWRSRSSARARARSSAREGTMIEREPPVGPLDALRHPRYAGIRTFARLPALEAVGRAEIAVLGAPYDGGTSFRPGARFGPAAIREAALLLRPHNEPLDVSPFAEVQVADAGDAAPNPLDIAEAHRSIQTRAAELHSSGARVLGLGGDHSV